MQRCDITGKKRMTGNNVPFSKHKTKRDWKPNLQKKTFYLDGKKVSMKLSAAGLRTLKKQGRFQATHEVDGVKERTKTAAIPKIAAATALLDKSDFVEETTDDTADDQVTTDSDDEATDTNDEA